jgi:hypothetical protein
MKVNIYITSKTNQYHASAIYDGHHVIVQKGGHISESFSEYICGGNTAKSYRGNTEYVNSDRIIIKDCEFKSLSTAAQFVSGRSLDGFNVWKVEKGKSIGKYLEEKGLR